MGAVGARCGGRLTSGTGPVSWFDWHWSWRSLGKAQSDGGNGPLSRLSCRRTMRRRRHRPSSLGIAPVSRFEWSESSWSAAQSPSAAGMAPRNRGFEWSSSSTSASSRPSPLGSLPCNACAGRLRVFTRAVSRAHTVTPTNVAITPGATSNTDASSSALTLAASFEISSSQPSRVFHSIAPDVAW